MAGTTGDDDAAATPSAAAGPAAAPAPTSGDHAPTNDPPRPSGGGGPDKDKEKDKRYDDAAEQVTEATSAADREEFRATIDELRGDIIAGDKIVVTGLGGARVGAYPIPPEMLAQPHVAAAGLRQIEDAFHRHGIVAVRGPEGSGRTAALLYVLTGGRTDTVVLRLEPQTDLRTLAPTHFQDAQALILENLTESHLRQLSDYEIGRLHSDRAGRWLGFTVSATLQLPDPVIPMVVNLGQPPPAMEVFTRHFEVSQPSREQRTALLAAAGVQERIAAALEPPTRLGRAAELAVFLAAYGGPNEELADQLDAWLTLGADAERRAWFAALPHLRAHCTALALAVLHGLSRETVAKRADRLVEKMATSEKQRRRSGNQFAPDAGISPAMLRAAVTREPVSFAEGDVTLNVLRYVDPTYRSWVLRHIWDEFDAARPAIESWLRDLGEDADRAVRVRAASAAGVLAERAFTTVHNSIIAGWAAGPSIWARRSAAQALSVPAENAELAPIVERLLEGWIDGKDPAWRATAALLVGATADPDSITGCLKQLADLTDQDDIDVAVAVATSLADLLYVADGTLAWPVLQEVSTWMSHQRAWRRRRSAGHLAFLTLTTVHGDPRVPRRRDDPDRAVPTLLLGAYENEAFAREVSRGWRDGLTARLNRAFGRSLTRWAERVEKRSDYRPVFVWLVRQAATDPRAATVVARAAQSWTDTAPQTAATVLATLKGVVPYG